MACLTCLAALAFPSAASTSDCDRNGRDDAADIAAGRADCDENGLPDECDLRRRFVEADRIERQHAGSPRADVVVGDFDGDGSDDVAVTTFDGIVRVVRREPDGTLLPPVESFDPNRDFGTRTLRSTDLDRDGHLDLILTCLGAGGGCENDVLRTLVGDGLGHFEESARVEATSAIRLVAIIDADGDGDDDIAIVTGPGTEDDPSTGRVAIIENRDGDLEPPRDIATVRGPMALAAADLDGDGFQDLAVLSALDGLAWLVRLIGVGGGVFESSVPVPTPLASSLTIGDLDGDARPDFALAGVGRTVTILLGRGRDDPAESRVYGWSRFSSATPVLADLDGDGHLDIVSNGLEVLHNKGKGTFYRARPLGPPLGLSALGVTRAGNGRLPSILGITRLEVVAISNHLGPIIGLDCNGNEVPDDCDLAAGTSFDCNADSRPDECDFDCDTNGIPDDCEIDLDPGLDANDTGLLDACEADLGFFPDCDANGVVDSEEDCDRDGVPDSCAIANGSASDCDDDGVPDHCEIDCDADGVPDDCAIANGAVPDANGDGVPDLCETRPTFRLSFDGPAEVRGEPGSTVRFRITGQLAAWAFAPEEEVLEGWSVGVLVEDARIVDARHVRADPIFVATAIVDPGLLPPNHAGAVHASAYFDPNGPPGLPARRAPYSILDLWLEVNVPEAGEILDVRANFISGLRARGQPVDVVATWDGDSCGLDDCPRHGGITAAPFLTRVAAVSGCGEDVASACGRTMFRRGDANADGRVDISDPIGIFLYLFLGGRAPPCADAADATDDERLDISDGILILEDFFRAGTGLAYPGPAHCGPDPDGERLDCANYSSCSP